MKSIRNQAGSSALAVILVLVVLVGAALVLTKVYRARQTNSNAPSEQTRVAGDVPAAPSISSTSDLNSAEKVLDHTDPDANGSDAGQLDQLVDF